MKTLTAPDDVRRRRHRRHRRAAARQRGPAAALGGKSTRCALHVLPARPEGFHHRARRRALRGRLRGVRIGGGDGCCNDSVGMVAASASLTGEEGRLPVSAHAACSAARRRCTCRGRRAVRGIEHLSGDRRDGVVLRRTADQQDPLGLGPASCWRTASSPSARPHSISMAARARRPACRRRERHAEQRRRRVRQIRRALALEPRLQHARCSSPVLRRGRGAPVPHGPRPAVARSRRAPARR